ncbi:MAG: NAD(P)-binding domain-containing protein [Terriglobales bacterium]
MSTVVFLGGGRITSALLAGLRLGKTKHRLLVHDRNPAKLRDLKKRYAVVVEPDLNHAIMKADVLIVAVRPRSVRELLLSVGKMKYARLAISLAAGVPLRALSKFGGPPVKWARAMPSPACRSGRGLTAVTFPRTLPRADRERVHGFFASLGQVVEIAESKLDAFTVTFSCSHGYHALATLARAAQAAGLDRKTALRAGAHALADGIISWRDGKVSLESLLEEAATPGGIAAATVTAMDAAGYGRAVRQGVTAGLRRARMHAGK